MTEIWIPGSARPKHQCNVPECGAKFHDTDTYIRHVTKCVKRNREALTALAEARKEHAQENPLISGEAFDPEALEFVERQRRR